MYNEFPMQIFGHAPSSEMMTFNFLNEIYLSHRDSYDFYIISDEMGKSKPSTLFFLSKFGCLLERVFFYSNTTIKDMWNEIDVLLTANPDLLLNHPPDKKVIKFETDYNNSINTNLSIKSLKDLSEIIKNL
jgi:FMN phosphatase YigB (HAD superfamily)